MPLKSRLRCYRCLFRFTAMLTALTLWAATSGCHRPEGSNKKKASIAIATLPEATLAMVAHTEGFFREEGLDMRAEFYPYGKVALKHLLDGDVDFATVAETPVMFAILNGQRVSVIATIVTTKTGHVVVARKDRGISAMGDLRGKTIATTMGTSAHFYLNALLVTHGISTEEVKVVDMPANTLPAALARGDIDAVSTFAPFTLLSERQSGRNAVVFGGPRGPGPGRFLPGGPAAVRAGETGAPAGGRG
jgi:ABC-type nitrate/sulfonate/bicarbonate transport system substrate-binding protein